MAGSPERNGHSNVAVGAVGAVAAAQRREQRHLLDCKGEVLSRLLIYKTRLLIMEHYSVPELYESGSVVTRISGASEAAGSSALDYACLHIDKANIGSYDYSALLYLADYGTDFTGGLFAFCDPDGVDRLVEPRKGRLVAFTSGAENLHQVRQVTGGTRHVLAMWFTSSRHLGLEVHGAPPASAAPVTQVSTLGRQKEIQGVLTAMRQDIGEVLAGISAANFAEPPPHTPPDDQRHAGHQMHKHILDTLQSFHDRPPVTEMAQMLAPLGDPASPTQDAASARQLLFFPREEHMKHYVHVLHQMSASSASASPNPFTPTSPDQRRRHVQGLFLNMLVLWHSRQWLLARAFMLAGGLQALVLLLAPSIDAHIRCCCLSLLPPTPPLSFCARGHVTELCALARPHIHTSTRPNTCTRP